MAPAEPLCLLCGGTDSGITYPFGTRWNGREFDYLRCSDCGASYIAPLPSEEDFRRMYSRSDYHEAYYEDLTEPTPTRLPKMVRYLPRNGSLLDFGCGNGAFMVAATRAGFRCEGIELDPEARAGAAANSGCPVSAWDDVVASGTRFDVIHFGDVLEHLPDPAGTMAALEPLLAPEGRFFIEGPLEDNRSLVFTASRLFGGMKRRLGRPLRGSFAPYHLFRASARAQRRFFERRLGWRVERFDISETGWPYVPAGGARSWRLSPAGAVRLLIGAAAIATGAAAGALRAPVGNRFAAIVRPGR